MGVAASHPDRGTITADSAANLEVVVLDDDTRWTASVRHALERVGRPVIEAGDPEDALRRLARSQASLLVVGPRAAESLRWIAAARRVVDALNVIVVTPDADAETAAAAFAAGATAVISETAARANLASTLALAAASAKSEDYGLSDRELEILEFVTRGLSNAQIARELWVSEPTVKFHLSRIYKKLGVASRTEAAYVARSQGLVSESRAG